MRLIIFDFDGVVADSETLGNQIFADCLNRIGIPATAEDVMRLCMGQRWADCAASIEARYGAPLPEGFIPGVIGEVYGRAIAEAVAVPGLEAFLERFAHAPRCIGSSSRLDYIAQSLETMGLAHWFEHRFSGQDVPRGKPHPDLFLKAAQVLGVAPADCVVIEDSPAGVLAGKAAGMLTIGLCAGGHALDDHAERLREAGADHVADDYDAVAAIVAPLFAVA